MRPERWFRIFPPSVGRRIFGRQRMIRPLTCNSAQTPMVAVNPAEVARCPEHPRRDRIPTFRTIHPVGTSRKRVFRANS